MLARLVVLSLAVCSIAGHGMNSGVLDVQTFTSNAMHHFEKFMNVRHPKASAKSDWESSRAYVKKVFETLGLETELQCFNTTVTLSIDDYQEVTGCNVIGVARGQETRNVMVIGAHYDSSGAEQKYKPLRQNGVGASVLLEVARAYDDSYRWKGWFKNYTTVFVAFDLTTAQHVPSSHGHPGSYHFVNSWLLPKLEKGRFGTLSGSIILDSIATYNTEALSQTLPTDFKTVFPDAYDRIINGSTKGDYLAAVAYSDEESKSVLRDFAGHYRMDRMRRPYRLQEMAAGPYGIGVGPTFKSLELQASYHFWTAKPALPSVLLTDTGDDRSLPPGEVCGNQLECNFQFANKERMAFVHSTYEAVTYTLLDRQATYVGLQSASAISSASSLAVVVFSLLFARFMNTL